MPSTQAAIRKQPTFFIPHGAGPCFFMDWQPSHTWDQLAQFLRELALSLPQVPKAIVMVSAHWCTPGFRVTSGAHPALIFDYYGFPPHTYELEYPAPGAPDLAIHIAHLLDQATLPCDLDPVRGFDHGLFVPLKLMFPKAQIPVVQLSLDHQLNPELHFQVGRSLASLRDENVLIVGSGMSFHNMRGYGNPAFGPISDEFDAWLTQAVESDASQRQALLTHWTQAPQARQCHPPRAEEHLIPLMVVAGAAEADIGRCVFSDRLLETTLSAFQFG